MQIFRVLRKWLPALYLCTNACVSQAHAQNFERLVSNIPFEYNGAPLLLPFFGGLDSFLPQFVDNDGDGDLDLFILKPFFAARERQWEGRLSYFENSGDAQTPRFTFRTNFYHDLEVRTWFSFLDVDADGDFDLYHDNGANGLTLQRNVGTRTHAQFMLAEPTVLDRNQQKVANEFSSTPAFADIDGDGDYDFFSGLSLGSIVFYRNVGNPTAPVFAFETNRWQDLLIVSGGVNPRRATAHGGNAIAFHDLDRDGDQDFFYGDFFHRSVYHMRNAGNAGEAQIAIADSLWPQPQPLLTRGYNAPRFADIDHNGLADLFVAVGNDNQRNFVFYQNEAQAEGAHLRFVTDNFLSQLDLGGNCAPALADLDSDGDFDLTLGTLNGELLFFENSGGVSAPAFRSAPNKFSDLRFNGYVLAPAFVDIDADQDWDLFAGNYSGTILFYENLGTSQAPAFVLKTTSLDGIRVGLSSSPHFADLDRDGDHDLAVGEIEKGAVTFYENTGSALAPRFVFKSRFLPETGTTDSKPFLFDWNRDGFVDLFLGQRNGRVLYYQSEGAPFNDSFKLAQTEFANLRVGASSAIAMGDLNNDGAVDLLMGEEAGGLNLYFNRTVSVVRNALAPPEAFTLSAYPNPFREVLYLRFHSVTGNISSAPQAAILNLLGKQVAALHLQRHDDKEWQGEWRVADGQHTAGVYFLRVHVGESYAIRKIVFVP